MDPWGNLIARPEEWDRIDKQLCGVVDRLHSMGYNRTLEVELRPVKIGGDVRKDCLTGFVPEFREKGIVTW